MVEEKESEIKVKYCLFCEVNDRPLDESAYLEINFLVFQPKYNILGYSK